ncbi:MAG TPA: deaminase [Solirubrobacteraceae bacterium]|nr:deaminase [Solirubrobacteraceae bacterium]
MSEHVAVAYVPVLHEGYRRFLEAHARGGRLFVVGPELYVEYRPLAKDIRALPADLVASAIAAWDLCAEVAVLDERSAHTLAAEDPRITMPAEDVSYQLAERFFARCEVRFDTVFLRWDKTRTAQLLRPQPQRTVTAAQAFAELALAADGAAAESVDWWRRVGAAIRLESGEVRVSANVHNPHPLSAYAVGDPRSNFHQGVALELSTATHAEARLIAQAARDGLETLGAVLYVTDFPCPPCAKLIAAAGIAKLYFRAGYAVLDGQDVLREAGVEVVQVS